MCLTFHPHRLEAPCFVAASPELREKLIAEVKKARGRAKGVLSTERLGLAAQPRVIGFEDGVIIPPDEFPLGTRPRADPRRGGRAGAAARHRARDRRARRLLRQADDRDARSTSRSCSSRPGVLPHGSVKEYFDEVSHGLVDHHRRRSSGRTGCRSTMAWYANGNFGIGRSSGDHTRPQHGPGRRGRRRPDVNFAPYDNDGNGFVDAFIVVHAGAGGEQTGDSGDIWSHKWVLPAASTSPTRPRSSPT